MQFFFSIFIEYILYLNDITKLYGLDLQNILIERS